jgi:hypothetical protein
LIHLRYAGEETGGNPWHENFDFVVILERFDSIDICGKKRDTSSVDEIDQGERTREGWGVG